MLQTSYQKKLKKNLKKLLTCWVDRVYYSHGRNSAAADETNLNKGCTMFVDDIIEKNWLSADGKKMHRTKYVGDFWVNSSTNPDFEIRGVYKSAGSKGVQVQMRDTKTGQWFWYVVA